MSAIGTGYDLSTTTYSTDGRVFQVEYAAKAVDNSGTTLAIRCRDGVVFAVEKMVKSKMLVKGSNRRIYSCASHVGMALAGLEADGRQLVNRARSECEGYKNNYGMAVPGNVLNDRMASFMHLFTCYWSVRPFGAAGLMGVKSRDGYELYLLEPNGTAYRYFATAIGKAKQSAKTELEKLNLEELSAKDALFEAAKILHTVHDSDKDKNWEMELSWISDETNGVHQLCSPEMRDEIYKRAEDAIADEEEDEEEDEEDED